MYSLAFRLFVLIKLVILVSQINCIDLHNDPNIPCGVKYNFKPGTELEDGRAKPNGPIRTQSLYVVPNAASGRGLNTKEAKRRIPKRHPKHRSKKAFRAMNKGDSKNRNETDLKIKTRIIGGHEASIKEFPWLVSIQTKNGGHICGGSIVTDEYIVTASHCVVDPSTNKLIDRQYRIGVGSSSWSNGKMYDVVKVIRHDGFRFENFEDDMALMKVHPRIQLKKGVTVPICLPGEKDDIVGAATIAGWGKTSNELEVTSNRLMAAHIDILDHSLCRDSYSNYNPKKMLCAGKESGEKDSCNGDSGGPLQALYPDGRIYLLGSVSFGDKMCGRAHTPGVYTRQTRYLKWVQEMIAKDKKASKSLLKP